MSHMGSVYFLLFVFCLSDIHYSLKTKVNISGIDIMSLNIDFF